MPAVTYINSWISRFKINCKFCYALLNTYLEDVTFSGQDQGCRFTRLTATIMV